MLAIGNDELANAPLLGDTIACKQCGGEHPVEYGDEVLADGTKKPSKLLAFFKCGDKAYLAGINGRAI